MTLAPGVSTFERLRARHARFRFRDYSIALEPEGLRFTYEFVVEPDIVFRPTVRLNGVDPVTVARLDPDVRRARFGLTEDGSPSVYSQNHAGDDSSSEIRSHGDQRIHHGSTR